MPRQKVTVMRHHTTHQPIAIYDGFSLRPVQAVTGVHVVPGKGRCYTCLYKGQTIRLWQMYMLDNWYIEVS